MWDEFHPASPAELLDEMRAAVRASLPEAAFLKRDRGDGLFVSNGPVFDVRIGEIPGFHTENTGRLIRIYPDACWLRKLEEGFGGRQDDLSLSLMRFRRAEPSREAMGLFCAGLKLLDAGEGALENEIAAFDRGVRQLAARALRKDLSGGGLYGLSLLDEMLK